MTDGVPTRDGLEDERWMIHALKLARRALGTTAPNPAVGAVVVRGGELLGAGHTQPVGGPHAETEALAAARAAGHSLEGATMYVTLEPCGHHGHTPPCTEEIIVAGITRVVVGVVDDNPLMRGTSLALLRSAGLEVELGVLAGAAEQLVRGFARAMTVGLPEVSCKAAISLDGHIATATGESQWITADKAREHAHRLRGTHDAVLIGSGTLHADDPRLTCRVGTAQPRPVVLDTELTIRADARLFDHPRRPILVCAEDAADRDLPADILRVRRGEGGIDVEAALRALVDVGVHRVLCEGGGRVHRRLLDAGLVDSLYLYVAPVVLPDGMPWVAGPSIDDLAGAWRLGAPEIQRLGVDTLLRFSVPHRDAQTG